MFLVKLEHKKIGELNKMKFNNEVIEQLDNYVYRLIDPRNGNTFYVGRGKGRK